MRFVPFALLILATFTNTAVHAQQDRTPVMEYAALLNSVDISPDGWLEFGRGNDALTAVFLPEGSAVEAELTRQAGDTPLHLQKFTVQQVTDVFSRVSVAGSPRQFRFTEPGDYVITFRSGSHVMAQTGVTVYTRQNDDEFDPKTVWYMSGPWSDWACAFSRIREGADATLQFRMWAKRESFEGETDSDIYEVDLMKDGDVVAEGRAGYISTLRWRNLHFEMRHPESKGGRNYLVKQFVARDGNYQFVVKKNQVLHAVFEMEVTNSRPVLHPREASDYKPRHDYICPRYASLTDRGDGAGNTVWMNRLDDVTARKIAEGQPAEAIEVSETQRKRWVWTPTSIDPDRPFEVVVTDVPTRSDTHISAGEDIIAFGTGHPTGVKYLRVGENQAREIPNGEVYSSTLFHVCGKKIVLVRKNRVFVYDTESEKTSEVPGTEVTLYNTVGGLHRGNLMNADGYLVVVVNQATSVADGNIIKVIDVSGDEPTVIPVNNANYNDRQVSSVAVDAKNGLVAVSSAERKLIAVAKVAPLANQKTFDMTDYRGVDRRQIYIEDDVITYADRDLKVRMLKAGAVAPVALTEEGLGSGNNGFVVRRGRLVVTTQQHVGTRYEIAISDLPDKPQTVSGTGDAIEGTGAGLGMGGCATIALDRTVFIAGTPSGGIGVGEHLQVLDNETGTWIPVTDQQGQVISAIDVTTSMGLLAFKSADRDRQTTIGYATYGQRVGLPGYGATKSNESGNHETADATASLELADDNPWNTNDEKALAMIQAYLETEKSVGEACVQAFGEEEGRRKTVDAVLNSMQENDQEEMIDEYKRLSTLVPDEDRPEAKESARQNRKVDPAKVMSVLNGEWKAIRFSAEGNDLPDQAIEKLGLTFASGKYVMQTGGGLQTGTYVIETSSHLMQMTIHIESGDHKGQKRKGAFKLLEDDRLLMVLATNSEDRPTRFVPDGSGDSILAVYEKTK